jgi:hypothetical protein
LHLTEQELMMTLNVAESYIALPNRSRPGTPSGKGAGNNSRRGTPIPEQALKRADVKRTLAPGQVRIPARSVTKVLSLRNNLQLELKPVLKE